MGSFMEDEEQRVLDESLPKISGLIGKTTGAYTATISWNDVKNKDIDGYDFVLRKDSSSGFFDVELKLEQLGTKLTIIRLEGPNDSINVKYLSGKIILDINQLSPNTLYKYNCRVYKGKDTTGSLGSFLFSGIIPFTTEEESELPPPPDFPLWFLDKWEWYHQKVQNKSLIVSAWEYNNFLVKLNEIRSAFGYTPFNFIIPVLNPKDPSLPVTENNTIISKEICHQPWEKLIELNKKNKIDNSKLIPLEPEQGAFITADFFNELRNSLNDNIKYFNEGRVAIVKSNNGQPLITPAVNEGSHYYAFSPQLNTSNYSEAYAKFVLPTEINSTSRNAFMALGMLGISSDGLFVISCDMGIANINGKGWQLCFGGLALGEEGVRLGPYLPTGTASIELTAKEESNNTSSSLMTIDVTKCFNAEGNIISDNLIEFSISIGRCNWNRYYRFMSFLCVGENPFNDGTKMIGGKFRELGLYSQNSKQYEPWGISSDYTENAWIVGYPAGKFIGYDNKTEFFNINNNL